MPRILCRIVDKGTLQANASLIGIPIGTVLSVEANTNSMHSTRLILIKTGNYHEMSFGHIIVVRKGTVLAIKAIIKVTVAEMANARSINRAGTWPMVRESVPITSNSPQK